METDTLSGPDPIPNSVQLAHRAMDIVGIDRCYRIAKQAGVGTYIGANMTEIAQAVFLLCDAQYPPRGNR